MELLIVLWGSERGRVRVGRGRCDGGGGVAVWQGDKVKRVGAKWGGIVGEGAMRQS